jgi:hypothetical protein
MSIARFFATLRLSDVPFGPGSDLPPAKAWLMNV